MENNRKILCLLVQMTKVSRCCQQNVILGGCVTFTQFNILDLVGRYGTLQLSELHSLLGVEKSTSTRLIEPLVQQGLIIKQRSEIDCRATNLVLTSQGQKTKADIWKRVDLFLNKVSAEIPEEKQDEVYENMQIFLKAVKNVLNQNCSEYHKMQ